MSDEPVIGAVEAAAYEVPTEEPESDGTLEWESTTIVVATVAGGGSVGIGYSYTDASAVELIQRVLGPVVIGLHALDVPRCWLEMVHAIRNLGRPGIVSTAISAVDNALWDLKAKILDLPLCRLLGMVRDSVPVYGSGGFTSYRPERLRAQLGGWADEGFAMVKMKVGRSPGDDFSRVGTARDAIGPGTSLMVDANGGYERKQALEMARLFAEHDVIWFEEPVTSDDLEGLRLIRDSGPPGMDIAAGEYGYDLYYFKRMLGAGAVDTLQVDATRCGGISVFVKAADLSWAETVPVSAHTAPAQHLHVACSVPGLRHIEYFHDHVRLEESLFEGVRRPVDGSLEPDLSRPGTGIELKTSDAEPYRVA